MFRRPKAIANRIVRKTYNRGKHMPIGQVSRPFGRPIHQIKTFSNTVQQVVLQTLTNGNTNRLFTLGDFMLASELTELQANHLQWRLLATTFTFKIIDTNNLASQINGESGVLLVPTDTTSGNSLDVWLIVHHSAASYNELAPTNNSTTNARQGIVNSNMAKKLNPKGYPLQYQWHQITGLDGLYDALHTRTDTLAVTTSLSTAFGINHSFNEPTGFQLNWFDIAKYDANSSLTLEIVSTAVIDLVGRTFQAS